MIGILALLVAFFALAGCSVAPAPPASLAHDVSIECGPIADRELCQKAVDVAATAKINPPPIAAVRIRRPDPSDECTEWFHPCGAGAVIVEIQSGDTIQGVPLVRTADGWVQLTLVR